MSEFTLSGVARAAVLPLALCASASFPLHAQDAPKFSVHGYLTQGWGKSDGTKFYGLTGESSTDFRYAALQLRYSATPNDQFVVQANHRRLGESQITDFESDVNLNWAFYQRGFRNGTTLKVGRAPIPRGIYNELRSVGVVLPMYRPPVVFYDEGAYYSETIDGLIASRTFFESALWSLEAHAYVGGWRSLAYDTWSEEYSVLKVRARNAIGAQLWLATPIDGVRLGVAAQRHDDTWEDGEELELKEFHVSFDATRERYFVRAEGQLQNYVTSDKLYTSYVQANYKVTSKLGLTGEVQRSRDTDVTYVENLSSSSFEWHRSDGIGLSYAFGPSLVFKVEHHWDRGIQIEQPAHPLMAPKFKYVIASLSASF